MTTICRFYSLLVYAFPDSIIAKEVRCARTKSTAVTRNALAPAAHNIMIAKVKNSLVFSLDESIDMGVQKREGPLIRYYDESCLRVETGFLGLQEVPQANASNLFECLDFRLTQDGISWNSYGASVMLGKHNTCC